MPGHNGLFARRFDLFAIIQLTLRSLVESSVSFSSGLCFVLRSSEFGIVIGLISHHGPGHAHGLVSQRDSGNIGVSTC